MRGRRLRVAPPGRATGTSCSECGDSLAYSGEHDAYYCARCNEWVDARCGLLGCTNCLTRPATPLRAGSRRGRRVARGVAWKQGGS